MKKNYPLLIMPFIAVIIIVSIFLFSGAFCPDDNGYFLKYQAERFKIGSGNANFYDDCIKYSKNIKYDAQKTFNVENIHKLKFYKSYSGGYILGAMSRFMSEKSAWKLISLVSVVLTAMILFIILKQSTSKIKSALFLSLFLVYPSIILAFFKMNQCIVSMFLVALILFVYFMKTDYILRWYLLSIIAAFLYVDNHFYGIIFYIIPILAYLETKKETTSAKAVARAAGLFAFGIAMNVFCTVFYPDGQKLFARVSLVAFLNALKSPISIALIINIIGAVKCPKYAKKYIYPSFVFYFIYILSALFSQAVKGCETAVLPAMFLGFATCVIHQKFFRKFYRIAVIFVCVITASCSVNNIITAINLSNNGKCILSEQINAEDEIDKIIPTEEIVYIDESNIKDIYFLIPRSVAILKSIPDDAKYIISKKERIENYQICGKFKINNSEKNIFVKLDE